MQNVIYIFHRLKKPSYSVFSLAPSSAARLFPLGEKVMSHRRRIGKLEAKIARNYVHQHLFSCNRRNDPDEIREVVFVGSDEELEKTVIAEVRERRTGEIPEYPRGLVVFDSNATGYFNMVKLEDEVGVF